MILHHQKGNKYVRLRFHQLLKYNGGHMGEKLAPRMVPITISGGTWNQSSDETREKYGIVGNYVLPGIPTGQLNSHQEPIFSQQAYTLRVDGTVDEHTY